jgi:hypothetical protein
MLGKEGVGGLAIHLRNRGVPAPIVGTDIGPSNEWIVELSWPTFHICVVTDLDSERDAWLAKQGWRTFSAQPGDNLVRVANLIADSFEEHQHSQP